MGCVHGCDDCVFNSANAGQLRVSDARGSRCELRNFVISSDPMFTACLNQVLRNPLRLRGLIGPIWAAAPRTLDWMDWDQAQLPPDLWLQGDERGPVWIPYAGRRRPRVLAGGRCIVCGNERPDMIAVVAGRKGEVRHCSVAHYWEWWWGREINRNPDYWTRTWLSDEVLSTYICMIMDWFPTSWHTALLNRDAAELVRLAEGFDESLRRAHITTVDVFDAAVILALGDTGGRAGEAMLRLWVALFDAGTALAAPEFEFERVEAVMERVEIAGENLFQALNPDLYPKPQGLS